MRTLTCTLAVALTFAGLAAGLHGQAPEFGFKLGPSFATLTGFDDVVEEFQEFGTRVERGWRTGYAVGGFARFRFGHLAFQPELMYVQKGVDLDFTATDPQFGDVQATIGLELDYFEIPVLLRVDVPAGRVVPFLYGGPYGALEGTCRIRSEQDRLTEIRDCRGDEVQRRRVDWGVIFGGGAGMALGAGRVFLEGRYGLGLRDINDAGEGAPEMNYRAVNLLIGYSFVP